jgi:hypothetical protein
LGEIGKKSKFQREKPGGPAWKKESERLKFNDKFYILLKMRLGGAAEQI